MEWNKTVFLAEWDHVQSVIARKSESRFKYRGWLYTLLSAVILAVYSGKFEISQINFLVLMVVLITLFGIKEFIIHVEHLRAIKRSIAIERCLRDEKFPEETTAILSEHMMGKFKIDDFTQALKDPRFFLQYLLLVPMVIFLAIHMS